MLQPVEIESVCATDRWNSHKKSSYRAMRQNLDYYAAVRSKAHNPTGLASWPRAF